MLCTHTKKLDRLEAREIKCVFIGYSNTQKGHKCYSLESKKISISQDVTFHEDKNYYRKDNSNSDFIENNLENYTNFTCAFLTRIIAESISKNTKEAMNNEILILCFSNILFK